MAEGDKQSGIEWHGLVLGFRGKGRGDAFASSLPYNKVFKKLLFLITGGENYENGNVPPYDYQGNVCVVFDRWVCGACGKYFLTIPAGAFICPLRIPREAIVGFYDVFSGTLVSLRSVSYTHLTLPTILLV